MLFLVWKFEEKLSFVRQLSKYNDKVGESQVLSYKQLKF